MRIQFCYSAFSNFGGQFRRKYGLERIARNIEVPCIFFGLYGKQVDRLLAHEGLAVVIWAGTDAKVFQKDKDRVELFKKKDNIKVIAISQYIVEDMEEIGVDSIHLPIIPANNVDIKPKPLGEAMYIYRPNSLKYGRNITREVRRRLPHIPVIEANPNKFNRKELLKAYGDSFVALRTLSHDGCSNTVAEMGLMGRPSIWNGGAPHCITWESVDDVTDSVRELYERRHEFDYMKCAQTAHDYYNIGEDFLYTEFYE